MFDEVAALTEWPVALTGSFDERFLALPKPVIVATLTSHQRYFPVAREDGALLPVFVTVANLESKAPQKVRDGNERVIRPRLADAAFFWEADRRTSLVDRQAGLANVVYQRGLGTLADKTRRVAALARDVAGAIGADAGAAERAAGLSKCDLLTGMVGEFPELQGTMGRDYALADGEPPAVADAIGEQYLPRFAGDALPQTPVGRALAIADKLDTLCGVFALGRKPTGNRDPFGLRRLALGVARILLEGRLDVSLAMLVSQAMAAQPAEASAERDPEAVFDFIIDRLRAWYLERPAVTAEMFEAVRARAPESLVDFDARLKAVSRFVDHDAAESLAATNKRIANILRQAGFAAEDAAAAPATGPRQEEAERALGEALAAARAAVAKPLAAREYGAVLERLAELRQPVDRFFDDVMVMTEDDNVRQQRLALLAGLRAEFLNVADISKLSIARA
ncbi:MAG: glycine--tRNA ligase subunit beta [Woeseiaceae bacterium]|nr:glycine--tRNA ligase subunit beta [Woeseiaceae bacterium]